MLGYPFGLAVRALPELTEAVACQDFVGAFVAGAVELVNDGAF